jgi:hypothetical protein
VKIQPITDRVFVAAHLPPLGHLFFLALLGLAPRRLLLSRGGCLYACIVWRLSVNWGCNHAHVITC